MIDLRERVSVAELARQAGSFYRELKALNPEIVDDWLGKGRYALRVPKGHGPTLRAGLGGSGRAGSPIDNAPGRPTRPGAPGRPSQFLPSPAPAGGRLDLSITGRDAAPREGTMLRTRVLRPRWLTLALVLWASVWLALPVPAEGASLPPARALAADGLAHASAIDSAALRDALIGQGLTPTDAELVMARLTPAERAELARRAGELGVGGDPSLVLIVALILVAAILLYLPMAGRMQGWW